MDKGTDAAGIARAFLRTIEDGDLAGMRALLAPEVRRIEHPNRIAPQGREQGLEEMVDGFEKGRALIARQRYDVSTVVADGEQVAMQMTWHGTLALPAGNMAAGDEMVARCALFMTIRDGRIIRIENYDCFEPF